MKVKELYTMDFNEACEKLAGETDIITTYESLKDFAIHMIQEDHLYLAMHILEAIHKAPADYYDYDYSMGTLEDPTPLTLTFDLIDYCDDGEDVDYEEF